MKHIARILFIAVLVIQGYAQIPPGYYNAAQGLTGAPLKLALHNIIKNHNSVSYSSLWTHFQSTDKRSNGKVWDIYSDVPGGTPPYQFTFVSDQCGSYNSEADCYNREHSWPQSWFNSETTPSSDLFHVYPTDGYVNNIRSNYPYAEVGWVNTTTLNGSTLGFSSSTGYASAAFEPIDEYKGDLARSYFYMSTRYMNEDAGWSTSAATNKSELLPWQVDQLLIWAHQDTVSAKEIARNNAIYQIQNNRNPYIDHPGWIDSIWHFTLTGIEVQETKDLFMHVYPNPSNENVNVIFDGIAGQKAKLHVVNILGEAVLTEEYTTDPLGKLSCELKSEHWESGVYFISIQQSAHFKTIRFIKY
ncbi:MAG: endonuclease [Bacteroidetes bacterium]|nr:endonuclease [Bacteroidota bacterium]